MKKSILLFILGLAFLLAGCRPDGILSRDGMASLLTDLYMVDGCVESAYVSQQPWDSLDMYEPMLEAHGVTPEAFVASLDYYLRHPDDFAKVYKSVTRRLEDEIRKAEELEMKAEQEAEEAEEAERRAAEEDAMDEAPQVDERSESVEEIWDSEEALTLEKRIGKQEEKPVKEPQKPEKKRRNARKRLSKEDLKELEKQLEQ